MRLTITHDGLPIGTVDLAMQRLPGAFPCSVAMGDFTPGSGYAVVREVIRRASAETWRFGFPGAPVFPDFFVSPWRDRTALAHANALSLQMCDEAGAVVPTDYVNIVEDPDPEVSPTVFVRLSAVTVEAVVPA